MRLNSLSTRIQVPANLVAAVLMIALAGLLLRNNVITEKKMVTDKATAMVEFLDKASVNYLINFDLSALDLFAKQTVKDDDFAFVVFVDEKQKPLTDLPAASATNNTATIVIERPIIGADGKTLGSVRLGYTLQRVWRHLPRDIGICAGAFVLAQALMIVGLGFVTRSITRRLTQLANQLSVAADGTAGGAGQVSAASQSLAEGASEQAASLEETSSSLEEMSSMVKRNAENAQKANDLAKQTRSAADKGVADMQAMSNAMEAIKASSDDIAKIIKTIDEIAFQTNILALNAAVEAARAGEAGMGFAVVADEVRNLAQRSAQAAKETAAKIEGAITKTGQGVEINGKVAQALNDIVSKARQVDELAAEVASASREQTQGITQINSAVGQMDKVTQANAANAEESAAAAQELNAQAETMKQSVLELLQLMGGAKKIGKQSPEHIKAAPPSVAAGHNGHKTSNGHSDFPLPAPVGRAQNQDDLIVWNEARMTTGNQDIDEQHQELIKMINNLHRACLSGAGKDELQRMMNFLAEYVQTHFRHEEGLMEQHNCPSKAANKAAHLKFLQTFTELKQNFEAHGPTTGMLLDLRKLVGDWLTTHICSIDTKLRQCPSAHNRTRTPVLNGRH